jgi:ankyrin repeat domain-containing protein 50
MDTATFLILRCNVYEQLYLSVTPSLDAEQALVNLRQSILELYTELLSFISVAARRYERHSAATVLKDMLSGDDLSRRLQLLSQLETRVNIEATLCGRALDDYAQRRLGQSYHVLRDMLNSRLAEIDDRLAAVWENVEESERRDILQWISEVAYESDHYNARSDRTPGTGEWLLRHPTFVEWAENYTSTILWLHGIRMPLPPNHYRKAIT